MKSELKLPKRTLRVWQTRIFMVAIILSAFLSILFSFYIFSAIVLLVCAAVSFVYFPLLYRSYVITVTDTYISVEKGVFIKSQKIMPRALLVYAESVSLPLSNALGLSAVILKAAKGYCVIPEIEKLKADGLILSIKEGKR